MTPLQGFIFMGSSLVIFGIISILVINWMDKREQRREDMELSD